MNYLEKIKKIAVPENKDFPFIYPSKEIFLPEIIRNIETVLGSILPEKYKEFVSVLGALGIEGRKDSITFLTSDEILNESVANIKGEGDLDNVFVFAVDNSGYYYFFDLKDRSGFGLETVYTVYQGNPFWTLVEKKGKNLEEFILEMIKN